MEVTASLIHNGHRFLPEGTTLSLTDEGIIAEILTTPSSDTAVFEGMLAPGFVNAHCHLELSHTHNLIPQHTGLVEFLKRVSLKRNDFTAEEKLEARNKAYVDLLANGIVAVGDIANTTDTLELRMRDKLHIHTFIESLGFTEANAARSFGFSQATYNAFALQSPGSKTLRQTITPHAPYSVSKTLFGLIDQYDVRSLLSIHNQESLAESHFYQSKEGGIRDLLAALGIDDTPFNATGKNSLQSYLEWLTYERPYLFVHNTYSGIDDLQFVKSKITQAFWCLCPNANLYIEGRLPDIRMFMEAGVNLCIGTDSLASNNKLCILSELQTIKEHYPDISWEVLLRWATHNGARALQMDDVVGSIEVGRKPGVIHISGNQAFPIT